MSDGRRLRWPRAGRGEALTPPTPPPPPPPARSPTRVGRGEEGGADGCYNLVVQPTPALTPWGSGRVALPFQKGLLHGKHLALHCSAGSPLRPIGRCPHGDTRAATLYGVKPWNSRNSGFVTGTGVLCSGSIPSQSFNHRAQARPAREADCPPSYCLVQAKKARMS